MVKAHTNPLRGAMVTIALESGAPSSKITGRRLPRVNVERGIGRCPIQGRVYPVSLTLTVSDTLCVAIGNQLASRETDLEFFGEDRRDGTRKPYIFQELWATAIRAGLSASPRFAA